jgi:hypothetical protein
MGMFLTKYSMLHALGYGDDSYVLPETKKILSKYKLFGLIIHDPATHKEFHNKLAEIFDRLDYITGEDFLFFCLTDPPKSFREKPNRDYFGIWEKDELLSPINAYKTKDESVTAYTLCQALGLEYEDLPIIILTNNFQFDYFRYIKTSSDHIENQLREIGFFCRQKQNYFNLINDPELLYLIKEIDNCGGNDIVNNQEPIAKTLADFLSLVIDKDRFQENKAYLGHAINLLRDNLKGPSSSVSQDNIKPENKSKTFLNKLVFQNKKKKSTLPLIEEYETDSNTYLKEEKKNLFLLGGISNFIDSFSTLNYPSVELYQSKSIQDSIKLSKPKEDNENSTILSHINDINLSIQNELIENESKIILRTFNIVYPHFHDLMTQHGLQLDFSPLIISLCKIFEIEINLSIVHWVRAELNIEMPTYFRKRKPGEGIYSFLPSNKIISNPRLIDFNGGIRDKWKAPGMGESELVCKTLHLENRFPDTLINDYNKFIHYWSALRNLRNLAAHTDALNKNAFFDAKNAFCGFNDSGYFDQLTNIKLHLKS